MSRPSLILGSAAHSNNRTATRILILKWELCELYLLLRLYWRTHMALCSSVEKMPSSSSI